MDALWQDIRYTFRVMRRQWGFASVVVLILALGVGVNVAIFSVIHAVVLSPLPYQDPDRLTVLWTSHEKLEDGQLAPAFSVPDFYDYRDQTELMEGIAAGWGGSGDLVDHGGEPEQVQHVSVTGNFFPLLGVSPILGRIFIEGEDDIPNSPRVAVLSYKIWQRRYGKDPDIIGKTINLHGRENTVIGVLPEDFRLYIPRETLIWTTPVDIWGNLRYDRDSHPRGLRHLMPIAKMKPGVSIAQAQAEADRIGDWIRQQDADYVKDGFAIRVSSMHQDVLKSVSAGLYLLWAAVGFFLLIVCVNVANMFLAMGVRRQGEVSLRMAVGALRGRIMRQLITENFLIVLVGAVVGVFLGWAGVKLIQAQEFANNVPRLESASIGGTGILFAVGIAILSAFLFGLVPALRAVRPQPHEVLKSGGRSSGSSSNFRLMNALVAGQVGLSLVLLIGAGLMTRSFAALQQVWPGFNSENVLTFSLRLPPARYSEGLERVRFYRQLEERLAGLAGIEAVGAVNVLPLGGAGTGGSYDYLELTGAADYRLATPGYFEAMGTNLLAGRFFTDQDRHDSRKVVIIDESIARRLWPGESAIGKILDVTGPTIPREEREVVGVVDHMYSQNLNTVARGQTYVPYYQVGWRQLYTTLRAPDSMKLVPAIKREIHTLDKSLPVADIRFMEAYVTDSLATPRLVARLLSSFAVFALLLACVGIYGMLSYAAGQRTREIGIRMAFGADRKNIFQLVTKQGMMPVIVGLSVGLVTAIALSQFLSSMLFGVAATDLMTFAGITAVFLVVAAAACFIPATRATRVAPTPVLRQE